MKKTVSIFLFLFVYQFTNAQSFFENDSVFNKKRTIGVSIFDAVAWGGSIGALQFVWYDDFAKSKFHIFDDHQEWQQMDKMGHMITSWNFARASGDLFEWSGINHRTSSIIGAAYSIGYMTTFEMLDGFNAVWGFSWSDVAYNSLGSLTYWSQEFLWNHQYAKFKFSCHNSGLADYRPDVLGSDFASRTLKDYNGQTYWMSFNPVYWFTEKSKIPAWINLSLGYSIEDQLYGDGSIYISQNGNTQMTFAPYRQYYLSFDIDFEEIPVSKPWLKFLLRSINVIKVPFPALEFSEKGIQVKALYF
ncbi:MAG: DUF2279 domain-containing protein [Crocinitomicaceae bacterium]|nr:DUF2279 domain-containing protein [Crocinitomicaceae bacterium]